MCKERKNPFIAHSENIDSSKHLSESELHLNHDDIKVFAENFSVFLIFEEALLTSTSENQFAYV